MSETTHPGLSESATTPSIANAVAILKPPITVQQWGELDGWPRYDLVDGVLKEKPDVALWHELLLMELAAFLHAFVKKHGLGRLVTSKAKLKISAFSGREPDIFFIPKALYHLVGKNLFKGVPPLIIEILSPSNEAVDRVAKRAEYAQLGVIQYWLVDFPNRSIEILALRDRSDGSREYELIETVRGDAVFRPTMFPGLEIPLTDVWPTEFENRTDE
jgi:Uma2 family endonuclease